MSKTIQIRVDEQMKTDVETLFSALGLDISTAVRMFFAKALREQGLPFEPRLYNRETLQAMEDAEAGRNLYGPFDTVDEMMASLLSDELDESLRYSPPWANGNQRGSVQFVAEKPDFEYDV